MNRDQYQSKQQWRYHVPFVGDAMVVSHGRVGGGRIVAGCHATTPDGKCSCERCVGHGVVRGGERPAVATL